MEDIFRFGPSSGSSSNNFLIALLWENLINQYFTDMVNVQACRFLWAINQVGALLT